MRAVLSVHFSLYHGCQGSMPFFSASLRKIRFADRHLHLDSRDFRAREQRERLSTNYELEGANDEQKI